MPIPAYPSLAAHLPAHQAARDGDISGLERLLDGSGVAIFQSVDDTSGDTALHIAAEEGQLECVTWLLRHGDIYYRTKNTTGETPAYKAALNGHLDCLETLIEFDKEKASTAANEANNQGLTCLHTATIHNHMAVIKWLLNRYHSTAFAMNEFGASAVHFAAAQGNVDILKLLTEHLGAAAANSRDFNGATPIYFAAQEGRLVALQYLVTECTGDPMIRANDGMTAVHAATQLYHLETVRWLIGEIGTHGIADRTKDGATPVHFAAAKGYTYLLRWFFDTHPEPNVLARLCDNADATPAHDAAEFGQVEALKLLLRHGADLFARDQDGASPYSLATDHQGEEIDKFVTHYAKSHGMELMEALCKRQSAPNTSALEVRQARGRKNTSTSKLTENMGSFTEFLEEFLSEEADEEPARDFSVRSRRLSRADADLEARTYCEEEEASTATARMDANEGGVVSDGSTRLAVQPGALPMDLSVSVVQHFSRAEHSSEGSPSESGDPSRLQMLSVVSCTPSGLRPKQSVQLEVNVAGEQGVAGDVPGKHELRVICTPGQLSRSSIASPPQVEDITDNCNIDADADTGIATMNITYFADICILRMNPTTGNLSVANGNGDGSGGGGASMGCLTDADRCQVSDFISSSISSTVVVKVFFRWFHATMGELGIGFGGTEDQFGAFNAADEVKSFQMKPLKLTSSDSFQVKVLVRDDDWMIPEDQLQSCEDQICSLEAEEISLEVVRRDNLSDSTTSDKPVVIRLELIVDSRTGKRSHARSFNLPPPPLPQRKGQRLSQAASGPWADERFPAKFYCGWIKLIDERILRDLSVECELLKGDIINDLVAATSTPSVHAQLYLDHITPLGEDTFDKFLAVVEKVYKHKVRDFEELRKPGSMADLKEKRENPWCDERFFSHDLSQWILELNPQRLQNEARRKRMWCRKYETGLYELRHTQQLHNEKFIRYMAPGEHVTFEKFLEIVEVFNKDKVEKFRELLSEAKTQRTRGVVRKTVVDPASPLVGSVVPDEHPATVTSTPSCEPTVIPPPRSESPCIPPSQPPAGDHTQEPPTSPTRQPLGEPESGKSGPASSPRPTKFEDDDDSDDDSSMSSCCRCC
ncbi:uncharacterized protein LOC135830945 isoform X2 [Sycon ciliatum]|uniref:uncharacterized protein LOC135830945 isoform X2 n=1 Tax=Sycon ciliatum TaxID=27933 RepID=UPI0031F63C0B